MGVTGLWPILAPVKKHRSLSSLCGQTLAVDLSIWVCENQAVRQMQSRVSKPHLRNLFFRISTLLQLGISLVFVIEGEAPTLKHEEINRRLHARNNHNGMKNHVSTKRRCGRGHLQGLLKECCELLDAVGVPYIQSQGEAESTCAALNAAGVVDACVTDDGDCFLYGAKMVYRNLTLDAKDPHVESYNMADVTCELGLTRERMVALALLLGCDYFPAGVPGVGEAWAVKLMTSLAGVDVLKRFNQWKHMTASDCADRIEMSVWRKAAKLPSFPPEKVIEEFLIQTEKVPATSPKWQRPSILKMMTLGTRYLEWPEEYSLEKILPLTTLWDQLCIMNSASPVASSHLQPCRIVKKRVRQGVPCFEVEWENSIRGLVDEEGQPRKLVTIEPEDRFCICFAQFVDSFNQHTEQLKASKSKRTRKLKNNQTADTLTSGMEALAITDAPLCPTEDNIQLPSNGTAAASTRKETASKKAARSYEKEKEEGINFPTEHQPQSIQSDKRSNTQVDRNSDAKSEEDMTPQSNKNSGMLSEKSTHADSWTILHGKRPTEHKTQPSKSCDAAETKDYKMKTKTSCSTQRSAGLISSQIGKKATVLADLLRDWSESDDEESPRRERRTSDSFIKISDDETDQELRHSTKGAQLHSASTSLRLKVNSPFTAVSIHTKKSPDIHTPAADRWQNPGNSGNQDVGASPESFISDGHFTLHHTLFTSLEDSEASRNASSFCEHSLDTGHVLSPKAVDQLRAALSPHMCDPVRFGGRSSPVSSLAQSQCEKSDAHRFKSTVVGTEDSLLSGDPCQSLLDRSSQVTSDQHLQVRKVLGVAGQSFSTQSHAGTVKELCDSGASVDYTLPLSQRLRLKQLNTKALNDLAHL